KRGGRTPTIVYGLLSSVIARPVMSGAAPKRRRHSASLNSATPADPGRSSSGEKLRPITGATPRIGSGGAVIIFAGTRSGSEPPVIVIVTVRSAPTASNERL